MSDDPYNCGEMVVNVLLKLNEIPNIMMRPTSHGLPTLEKDGIEIQGKKIIITKGMFNVLLGSLESNGYVHFPASYEAMEKGEVVFMGIPIETAEKETIPTYLRGKEVSN